MPAFWHPLSCDEELAVNLVSFEMMNLFSLTAFKIFCLSLTCSNWSICVWVWICVCMYVWSYLEPIKLLGSVDYCFPSNLGSFQPLFLWIYFLFLSLASLLLVLSCICCCAEWCLTRLWSSVLFSTLFPPVSQICIITISLSPSLYILILPVQIYYWASLVNLSPQWLYFSTSEFSLGSFLI